MGAYVPALRFVKTDRHLIIVGKVQFNRIRSCIIRVCVQVHSLSHTRFYTFIGDLVDSCHVINVVTFFLRVGGYI